MLKGANKAEELFYDPREQQTYYRFETGSFKFRKAVIAIIAINRMKRKLNPKLDHSSIAQTVGNLFR